MMPFKVKTLLHKNHQLFIFVDVSFEQKIIRDCFATGDLLYCRCFRQLSAVILTAAGFFNSSMIL